MGNSPESPPPVDKPHSGKSLRTPQEKPSAAGKQRVLPASRGGLSGTILAPGKGYWGAFVLVRNDGSCLHGEVFLAGARKPDISADPVLPLGSEVSGDEHLLHHESSGGCRWRLIHSSVLSQAPFGSR